MAWASDELVTWLLSKRAWINPLSATAFTPDDIAAIRAWGRPEIKRLAELDDAATAHVLLAWDAQTQGNAQAQREHLAQAAALAPDRAEALRDQWATLCGGGGRQPRPSNTRHAGLFPPPARRGWRGLFGRRASETLPAGPQVGRASSATLPARAPASAGATPPIPPTTWDALRRLADALIQDASADLMPSLMALVVWQQQAGTLAPDVLAQIDAQVRIFGKPFSEQCRAVVDPNHRVDGRRCGATDLGRELHKALLVCRPVR